MKSTRCSPKRTVTDAYHIKIDVQLYKSMPSTDDRRLQDIFSRACGSTTQSSDSTSALALGKYNHFREAYVLNIHE
jgi:hypothetical protein